LRIGIDNFYTEELTSISQCTDPLIEVTQLINENHAPLSFIEDEGVFDCLENNSDYIIKSELTNKSKLTTKNIMSNINKVSSVYPLLEKSKLALQQHKEGLKLIDKLESLNTQINEAEIKLETHINNLNIINVHEVTGVKARIEERSEYLEALNNEISKYEKDVVSDVVSPSDKEILEKSYNIQTQVVTQTKEKDCEINEEYFTDREIKLDNLTTEFKNLVNNLQIRVDGKLGSHSKDEVVKYLKDNKEWGYYKREEILEFLNSTGKIYSNYMTEIIKALATEWKDEYMPF
jgi:hypothetical protein